MLSVISFPAVKCREYRIAVNVLPGHYFLDKTVQLFVGESVVESVAAINDAELLDYTVAYSHIVLIVHTMHNPEAVLFQVLADVLRAINKAYPAPGISCIDDIFDCATIIPA